ncbi:hypothetical protein FDP41_000115 [Naegleria fowleri]|uniref:Uncharacterized protein n=1 Tax=Naegleria fowleri TaxID=5763 RepID=A0A6A5CBI9_NAEFO|nr:uncharacterized protein FDP41_000115 [Naegleria fowleri]KAF0985076.1 hypothetical protein FDP41_000115 [Naegleria fowleri]
MSRNYHLDLYLSNGKAFCSFPSSSSISTHEELVLFLEREYEKFYPTEDSISIKAIQHLYLDKESGMPVKFELPTNWEDLSSKLQVKSKIIEVICGNNPSLFLQVEKSENRHEQYNDIVSPVPGSVRKKAVENSVITSVASSLSFNGGKNLHSNASNGINNLTLPEAVPNDDSAADEKVVIFAEDDDTVFDDALAKMEMKASQGSQLVNTNEPSSSSQLVDSVPEVIDVITTNSDTNTAAAVTNDNKPMAIDNVNDKPNDATTVVPMDTKDDNKQENEDEEYIFSIESDDLNEQPLFSSEKQAASIACVSPVMDASYEDNQIDEEQKASQKTTPVQQEQTKEDSNLMVDEGEDEELQQLAVNDNILFTQNPTLELPEEEPVTSSPEERKHEKLSQTPQSKNVTPSKASEKNIRPTPQTTELVKEVHSKPFSFASIFAQKSDTKSLAAPSSQERSSSQKHSQEHNSTTSSATPSKKSSQQDQTNVNTPKQSSQRKDEEHQTLSQSLQPFTPSTPISLLQRIKNCKTPNPSSSQQSTKDLDSAMKSKSASKIQKNKSKLAEKVVKDALLKWNQKKKK